MSIQHNVKNLISEGKTEKAINKLLEFVNGKNTDIHNQVIVLKNNFKKGKRDSNLGMITFQDWNQVQTRVNAAMLDLLPEIDGIEDNTAPTINPTGTQQASAIKKTVFISYNHKDKTIAHKLKDALQQEGIEVTIDSENMKPGGSIRDFIDESVNHTNVTLSLVSKNSLLSSWVSFETINTFYLTKVNKDKKFIACYINDDFFNPRFELDAVKAIDAEILELDKLISEYSSMNLDSKVINAKKTNLHFLRKNLGDIIFHLNESLCIDIRGNNLEANIPRVIKAIKGQT